MRVVPAVATMTNYTVRLVSPATGVHGAAGASIVAGGLHVRSEYDLDGDGTALVAASSVADAIRLAITGSVTVNTSKIMGLMDATYTFDPTTVGTSKAGQPFFWSKDRIWLEDLAAFPAKSDKDYNDDYWQVNVKLAPVAPIDAPVVVDPKTMAGIKNGTVTALLDPTKDTRIEIRVTGGHIDGSIQDKVMVEVGVGTARRKVTVTLTSQAVDPKVDAKTKAHEIQVVGTVVDPGPPAGAKPADVALSPPVTTVRPKDGKDRSVRKTEFPTNWTLAEIEAAIKKGAEDAQKKKAGTSWTPAPNNPNQGRLQATVNGVKITADWQLIKGNLVITHAFPES